MDNQLIAYRLRQHARQLDARGGNLMRVRAYRRAAQIVADWEEPLTEILERGGRRALRNLPAIGRRIALAIESLINTGTIPPRPTVTA